MAQTRSRGLDLRHAARWSIRLLVLVFGLLAAGAVVVLVAIPRATQGQAMTVLSGSMTPGIPVGSVVVVRPVDPARLQVGDVATYQAAPGKPIYVTHRIIGITQRGAERTFTFKGDANRGPDLDPVVAAQIRGRLWFHVPYLGAIRDDLQSGSGKLAVLIVILGGYALSQLGAGLRERHGEREQEHAVA